MHLYAPSTVWYPQAADHVPPGRRVVVHRCDVPGGPGPMQPGPHLLLPLAVAPGQVSQPKASRPCGSYQLYFTWSSCLQPQTHTGQTWGSDMFPKDRVGRGNAEVPTHLPPATWAGAGLPPAAQCQDSGPSSASWRWCWSEVKPNRKVSA